jgi:hypothetical protein
LDLALPVALGGCFIAVTLMLDRSGVPLSPVIRVLLVAVGAVVCFSFSRRPLRYALGVGVLFLTSAGVFLDADGELLHGERSFFGMHRVLGVQGGELHALIHGNTMHGLQWSDPARRREPLTYYTTSGPIGQVFATLNQRGAPRRTAVIGLGAGSLACYRQPGEQWTFYEIDPAVVRIARDDRYFSYLRDCAPDARIVLGDARLQLAKLADRQYDLIVLDAFTSDAPPLHLLTREALAVYRGALAPGGVLAFHISNVYFDLGPIVASLAGDAGLSGRVQTDRATAAEIENGKTASRWAVLAEHESDLGALAADGRWQPLSAPPGTPLWTDDFSSIVSAFRGR